ncbi:unnamed protein product [Mycena citricolor]|uniref:Uncharacterized protein n=1 Tax=Mycena citricolor TaxID=2018698 RepID=A0AAD2GYZ0_9AGAR|nr:unnamed protein product [Mycena citricolor]
MLTSTQTTWLVVAVAFSLTFNVLSYRQLNLPFASELGAQPLLNELPLLVRPAALQFSLIADEYRIADDAAWATLVPSDDRIRSPSAAAPDQKYFTVGLYSDLRCLNLLRTAYLAHKDKHESEIRFPEDALAPQCVSSCARRSRARPT